jgi:hypothetical protein
LYSPKIIDGVLDDFEAREGWRPVPHSVSEVVEFNGYIDSIVEIQRNQTNRYIDFKPDLRITERRKKEITHWIENEQFYCFASAEYWKTRYGWICNDSNDVCRYTPRKSQQVFDQVLYPFDELQVAIELFVMKSRQVGISTDVALDFLHRLFFIPHTQAVMASVKAKQSELLARIMEVCWERQPFWLVPNQTVTKSSQPQWANGSILSMQSGSQAMGIAQGWTPSLIHISEIADIPKPKKVLEEGLFRAAHSTRKLFFVLEGTGGDSTSWQADKWKYYKANWEKGGRFMPVFITWPCATDLYPEADWIRKNPIPEMWQPLEETRRMQRKAELYIRSTDYLARIMGARWTMPREQAWFWETNYREALASHTVKVWLAQMPVSDDEALQSKNDLVFSDGVIENIGNRKQREYQAYAVTGQSVIVGQNDEPYTPDSESIDYDRPRIPVAWKSKGGQMNYWELIPLKDFDDDDDTQCFNKLLVFDEPKEREDYSIGIDTADGLGNPDEDRSVADVVLNRTGNQRDIQVAEFVSLTVNPPQMVSIAACLAAWYGQYVDGRSRTKDPRGVKFCIEQRERYGDDCQFQLKLMGFYYHHVFARYDDKKIELNKGHKHGWFSNVWSVPMLLNRFEDAIMGGWLKVNSPMAIRQLSTWVRKISQSGKSKLDHESGQHDDNLRALAMAYFTRHSNDVLVNRQTEKYATHDERTPPISEEWCENRITL